MEFQAKKSDVNKHKTQCAVVFAHNDTLLGDAAMVDESIDGLLSQAIKTGDLDKKFGKSLFLPVKGNLAFERVLLVQLGKDEDEKPKGKLLSVTQKDLMSVFATCAKQIDSKPIKHCSIFVDGVNVEGAANDEDGAQTIASIIATEFERNTYRYTTTLSKKDSTKISKVSLVSNSSATVKASKAGLTQGAALASGINYARELGNLPGNICTPTFLASQAEELAKESEAFTTKILGEKQMQKLKMGSFLSVAHGSDEEGKLIVMEYKNGSQKDKPHVLVGKGITFDTGGISLKPGPQMDEMKFDMCGAASVFGTMKALVEMNAKVNVIGIVAAAENMPSGRATKPGDVVTSMAGLTIEVLNTDAEGRLVLCDALTYAGRYKPKTVVDIATLTGACVIALGNHASGIFSNDDALAQTLLKSGEATNDRAWQMPIWDEYQKSLDSNFADIANIGGREAGSITAACFLSRFTKDYKWAHIDIAGSAWNSGARKGATGRPVALLVNYLLNN